jgi:hypothetical protein
MKLDWLSPASKHVRRGRIIALALMLVLFGSAYALLFSILYGQAPPVEKTFQRGATRRRLLTYIWSCSALSRSGRRSRCA